MTDKRYNGFVALFKEKEGYGFIRCKDFSEDLFVHYKDIEGTGYRSLAKGQKVQFNIVERKNGMGAIDVKITPDEE